MIVKLKRDIIISRNYKDLLQSKEYEKHIFELMKASSDVFPDDRYEYVENQSNGEPDYKDSQGNYYDAKLLVDKNSMHLLLYKGDQEPDFLTWFKMLKDEVSDFKIDEYASDYTSITKTKLFSLVKERIEKNIEHEKNGAKENIIIFAPFPLGTGYEGVYIQFGVDFCKALFDRIESDVKLDGRELYFIYPAAQENTYMLRQPSRYGFEVVTYDGMKKYIQYTDSQIDVS